MKVNVNYEKIPNQLKQHNQFVWWKAERGKNGKLNKIPIDDAKRERDDLQYKLVLLNDFEQRDIEVFEGLDVSIWAESHRY